MRRYWVEEESIAGDRFILKGDTFHHIVDVCRMGKGDKFEILNEKGMIYFVELENVSKKHADGKILESRKAPEQKRPHIVLALSVPRFNVIDNVIEKAVELGVSRIQPFTSDFSFIRNAKDLTPQRLQRWDKIVKSAAQQTGRADLLKIEAVKTLPQTVEQFNRNSRALGLWAYEGEGELSLKEALQKAPRDLEEVWVFVGSEGGFSRQEIEFAKNNGFPPLTLGDQVLRVETACVALISVIKYELGTF